MQFTIDEDVALSQADSWETIADFDAIEALLRDRKVDVTRTGGPTPPGLGTTWAGTFTYGEQERPFTTEVTECTPPEGLTFTVDSAGVQGVLEIKLESRAAKLTHVSGGLTLTGKTIKARIFLQPLRLAHGKLQAKIDDRMGRLARAIEARGRKRKTSS